MIFRFIILLLFISGITHAQQWDSLHYRIATDTLLQKSVGRVDSLTLAFQGKADSINSWYNQQYNQIEGIRTQLQKKVDSVTHLQQPTHDFTRKLDSLDIELQEKLNFCNRKMADLKSKATEQLHKLPLTPELSGHLQKLEYALNEYSLPSLNTSLTSGLKTLKMPDVASLQLPTLSKQLNLGVEFDQYTKQLTELKQLTGKAGDYVKDVTNLAEGNLDQVKHIDKTLESKLAGVEGMGELAEGQQLLSQYSSLATDSAAMADKVKELAREELMEQVQDHFGGQQQVLKEAMDKMGKLKMRYSSVASMADLPKRLPNPYKELPRIERFVPALTLQVQKSNYYLLDVNPMLLYKISPRFSAGAGFNYRLVFDELTVRKEERIYGPRAAVEFHLNKGMSLTLLPELMYTTIPPNAAMVKGVTDPAYKEWVPGIFAGLKKEFKLSKNIKGNTQVLYNLYDPENTSPYAKEFSVRVGFEFGLKRKVKTADQ